MDRPFSSNRIEDAESILGSIRRAILVHSRDGLNQQDLGAPLADSARLRSWAETDRLTEIESKAVELESLLLSLANNGNKISDSAAARILDSVSGVEVALASHRFTTDHLPTDLSAFVEESFRNLNGNNHSPVLVASFVPSDDIDDELREVFATEADELLSGFEHQIDQFRRDSSDKSALWEIRRISHTFKGAAGVVGLNEAAKLAHRIEDLFDRLANTDFHADTDLVSTLTSTVECLRSIVAGNPLSSEKLANIYAELDRLTSLPDQKTTSPHLDTPSPKFGVAAATTNSSSERGKTSKSIVRVSLTALDDLTRYIRDLAANLSQFEQSRDISVGPFFEQQKRLTDAIQNKLSLIRMVEFGTLTTRLQRAVRVACEEENKTAEIAIENAEYKVDTQILDALVEPVMHLLRNAVVHGVETPETRRLLGKPEDGLIKVNIFERDSSIFLSVSDDGRGIVVSSLKQKAIDAGIIDQREADVMTDREAWELVFRSGLSTANKLTMIAGRGIGMSIVKESVEALHGSISIDSTPHSGSTFTIRVPIASDRKAANECDHAHLTILTVDDSASVRAANEKLISMSGWKAIVAKDGLDAVEILAGLDQPPDLILTDLEMPEMNGFELIKVLKESEEFKEIPVVVLTTRVDPDHSETGIYLGAEAFIEKPLDEMKLRRVVDELVGVAA